MILSDRPKVLIVDDREENLFAMKQLLREIDAELFTADSGNAALQLMLHHRFSVVLLDVQMPDMDGFETAELMRSHEDTRTTPIIFLTAISKEEQHVFRGYAAGCVDYLFKPIDPDILVSKVRVFIEMHRAALMEKQLILEQRKVANLESIGTLAGGIAHDFNNLFLAILGNIELAEDEVNTAGNLARTFLGIAKERILAARELTGRLITFAKGGGMIKGRYQLAELLRETISDIEIPPNITLTLQLDQNLPLLVLDRRLVSQAIANIMHNACEAMPGGGALKVSTEMIMAQNQGGAWVAVRIADTGVGIAPEDKERIFDPYFSTKEQGSRKGMGMGLAVVHSIVRQHGGEIKVESERGKGTVVQLRLPVPDSAGSHSAQENGKNLAVAGQTTAPRILVLDGEPFVRELIHDMATRMGYETWCSGSGQEVAREYVEALGRGRPYTLVIFDLEKQSDDSGESILRTLRRTTPELPAMAMIDSAADLHPEPGSANGDFQVCLRKPFGFKAFRQGVETALGVGGNKAGR